MTYRVLAFGVVSHDYLSHCCIARGLVTAKKPIDLLWQGAPLEGGWVGTVGRVMLKDDGVVEGVVEGG